MCEQPSTPQGSKAQTPSTLSSTPWREAPKISAPNLGVGNYGTGARYWGKSTFSLSLK
jgi:hypothetical protein